MPEMNPISRSNRPRVVIIGGGFGGLAVARVLAKAPVDVTVIDRNNHHVFQPLLYQVATAGLSPADIAAPIRSILSGQANASVVLGEVAGIDTARRVVQTVEQEIAYDYLVVATGVRHSYFGHPEWEKFAPGLKTLKDATSVRKRILMAFEQAEATHDEAKQRALMTIILVGGGPTGVEMAGTLSELTRQALRKDFRRIHPELSRIVLVEASERVLGNFPEHLALKAQDALKHMGIEVRCGFRVNAIDETGVTLIPAKGAQPDDPGERIESQLVLWTAGVQATSVGSYLGVELDRAGRVRVQSDLSIPGHPEVFVVGDAATLEPSGPPLPGVAQVAMQGGTYVGKLIAARVAGNQTSSPFVYKDKGNMATVGRKFAIVDIGRFEIAGFIAWIMWSILHVAFLIGFRNRMVVILQWLWAYVTFQRGARLIT
jgi:NADH dehydrogenase